MTPRGRKAPFSQEDLNQIFVVSPKQPDRLVSRESERLEFKESFGFNSLGKYIRSAAAFANAKGGYIVYGVGNSPHILHGLKNEYFDQLDPAKLTEYLNDHFDPEIHCERQLYEFLGKTYGLLYIHESENKPVLCRKSADDGKSLKEGEIYYRYRGRTQVIRYAELKELIEERRRREQLLWLKHLKDIARIGIRDVGLFDLKTGSVSGPRGSFLIDESLLPKLAFIREGEFTEVKGKPAIKLVGTAKPIGQFSHGAPTRIVRQVGVRAPDIILAFLRSEKTSDPVGYFSQISYETSAFLPFYFLLFQAKLSPKEALLLISVDHSTCQAKTKLLERLTQDDSVKNPLPLPSTSTPAGIRKLMIREALVKRKHTGKSEGTELSDLLEMIRTLSFQEIDETYLKDLLLQVFNCQFAKSNAGLNDKIRRAVCYLDASVHATKIKI